MEPRSGGRPDGEERFPQDLVRAVKRSTAYRRYRCHLAEACPSDAWTEGRSWGFVVFALAPSSTAGTHLGFAVDRALGGVTRVRVLEMGTASIRGRDAPLLPPCGERTPVGGRLNARGHV